MDGNKIREWRQKRGWSLQRLADAAKTTKGQVDKLEKGHRRLTVDWMVRLAKPLGCDPREFMPQKDASESAKPRKPPKNEEPLAIRIIGKGGALSKIARPVFLEGSADAYAVKVSNKEMDPMYRNGQILFVDPRKKAAKGSGVVVSLRDGTVMARELAGTTAKAVKLKKYSPLPSVHEIPKAKILSIHAIAGTLEP